MGRDAVFQKILERVFTFSELNLMLQAQSLLSICIPTYNRPNELTETLRILGEQFDALSFGDQVLIDIIVSDNNSPSTQIATIFNTWAECRPNAVLHIQQSNVGPTLNFEYCYQYSRGKFIFILSDDDHLTQGSLSLILESLKSDDPDILFLPFFPLSNPGNENSTARLKIERDVFLEKTGLLPTLISACIFKRNMIAPYLGRYLDTNMHHFYYFLCGVETGQSFVYLNRQILFSPYDDNSGGYNWFKVFAGDFFCIINEFPCIKVDKKILDRIKQEMFSRRIIPNYVNRKINGHAISNRFTKTSNLEIIYLITRHCHGLFAYWLLFLPIVFIPSLALIVLKKIYIDFRKVCMKFRVSSV